MGLEDSDDSWGYHSEDGGFFPDCTKSSPYASGDVVGCMVDPVTRTAFFTLNGNRLGTSSTLFLLTLPAFT